MALKRAVLIFNGKRDVKLQSSRPEKSFYFFLCKSCRTAASHPSPSFYRRWRKSEIEKKYKNQTLQRETLSRRAKGENHIGRNNFRSVKSSAHVYARRQTIPALVQSLSLSLSWFSGKFAIRITRAINHNSSADGGQRAF